VFPRIAAPSIGWLEGCVVGDGVAFRTFDAGAALCCSRRGAIFFNRVAIVAMARVVPGNAWIAASKRESAPGFTVIGPKNDPM
jgi:hypothetical protein